MDNNKDIKNLILSSNKNYTQASSLLQLSLEFITNHLNLFKHFYQLPQELLFLLFEFIQKRKLLSDEIFRKFICPQFTKVNILRESLEGGSFTGSTFT